MKTLVTVLALATALSACGKNDENTSTTDSQTQAQTTKPNETEIASPFTNQSLLVSMTSTETCTDGKCIPTTRTIFTYSDEKLLIEKTVYALKSDGTTNATSFKVTYSYNADKKLMKEVFSYDKGAPYSVYNYNYSKDGKSITKTQDTECSFTGAKGEIICNKIKTARDDIILDDKSLVTQINHYDSEMILVGAELNEYNSDASIALHYSINSVYKNKENPVSKSIFSYSDKLVTETYYSRDTDKLDVYSVAKKTLDSKNRIIKEETTYPSSKSIDITTYTYSD